jgi:short-subunit dehydrogenase
MQVNLIGAGPGISQSVAQLFGKQGFTIGLVARGEEKLRQQAEALAAQGIEARYAAADVADGPSVGAALDALGLADLTLFNASAISIKDILEQDWETIRSVFEVNTGGAFHVAKKVLPLYLARNAGKLFFTGGGSALAGDPQWTALGIGKAGMRNLVQALVKRAEGSNVHVAQLTVRGMVSPQSEKHNPDAIAAQYWRLWLQEPGSFEAEVMY